MSGNAMALGTVYSPALTAATWQDQQPEAPWQMAELWLLTEQGLVGLIDSTATAANQARELCHQFRFIIPKDADAAKQPDGTYQCGDLRLKVWATDLPFPIEERMRRYCMADHDRRDWQLTLSDADRSPEQLAQAPPKEGQPRPELKLPELHDYPAGYHRSTLLEVSPGAGYSSVKRIEAKGQVGVEAKAGGKTYRVLIDLKTRRTTLKTG